MNDAAPPAILAGLDPLAAAITAAGWELARGAIEHRFAVGGLVTVLIAWLAFSGRRARGHRVGWVAAALLAGTWAQIALFSNYVMLGAALYGLAVALAVPFGVSNSIPVEPEPTPLWLDLALGLLLTALALTVRLYALDQLPAAVDFEAAQAFFESLTPHGLAHYIAVNRVEDDGFFHMLARYAVQYFTGPSLLGIRLAGVLCGTAAVPLCYALVRRLTGVFAAVLAALLLATAPEQLIFSRIETTQLSLVPLAALVTAHLTLWLCRGWRLRAGLATALWMPLTRYFYAPAIVLFLLPIAVALHGVLFGPRRRGAIAALPILFAGAALWLAASPALHWAATGKWGDATSLRVYGVSVVRPAGIAQQPGDEVSNLRFLLARSADHSVEVLRQLGYHHPGYSAWYLRDHPVEGHLRMICAALLVPLATGLGFLLGRWRDARAVLLLAWLVLGLLPGIISDEPDPRRLTVFFAAVPVVVGVFLDAVLRAVRAGGARLAGWSLRAAFAAAVACIALSSLAVHFRIFRSHMMFSEYVACTRQIFAGSDLILHNLDDDNTITVVAFGNATPFLSHMPALQRLRDWRSDTWSTPACTAVCPFASEEFYSTLLTPEEVRQHCDAFAPVRVTYLLRVETDAEHGLACRVLERFPDAAIATCIGHDRDDPIRQLIAFTVAR
ncbi:MAG: glycosyltransferase family 39 protein [bacterium]